MSEEPMQHRSADTDAAQAPTSYKVWDIFVRLFHWSLVIIFVVAWVTAEDFDRAHEWAGYAAGGLIMLRLVWGLIGTKYARFTQFVKSPATVIAYIRAIIRGDERRYLGHNPAGGAMVIVLVLGLGGVILTGWMLTLDGFRRSEFFEEGHEFVAILVLLLIGLHVLGVIFASLNHRENLIRSMFTGTKRGPEHDDVA